jgi:hypothetical protein
MGYKRVDPTVYVVVWDADSIVKVGYSERQRWRKFALRGARVAELVPFRHFSVAMSAELEAHEFLWPKVPLAFDSASEAVDHLGPDGGGWCETYRLRPEHASALRTCIAQLHARAYAEARCTNERDERNGLTHEVVTPLLDIFPVRYAHASRKAL